MTFLCASLRSGKPFGLATIDLRDQFSRWVIAAVLLFSTPGQADNRTVLSVLTQPQRLDAGLVQEYEASRKVSVRVELVTSSLDYDSKIRSLPHNWDLVLADEQRLVHLSLSKMIKPLPETVAVPADGPGLERRARANPDGRAYLNLMADPLGIMFLSKTLTATGPVGWEWLIRPVFNPLWRSRLVLFADERMNMMTAAAATGLKFPVENPEDARVVKEWLAAAHLQGRPMTTSLAIPSLLAEKSVVSLAWQSDFVQAQRYMKDLSFTVPLRETYVERVGVGLVSDCQSEQLALDFIRFIYERKQTLAQRRGLLSLEVQQFQDNPVAGWRIFSDDVSRLRELTTALSAIKKDRDLRAQRRR